MSLEIANIEILREEVDVSDRLIKNMPNQAWDELKRLAKINGVTLAKMIEILVIRL